MPYRLPIEQIAVANAGGTINVDVTSYVDLYTVSPATTGVLTGNTTIAPTGTDIEGSQYNFYVKGGITLGAFAVTIFGYSLTAVQADKGCWLYVYYNGSTYDVQLRSDEAQLAVIESDRLVGNIPLSKLAIDARLTTNTTNIATTGGTTSFPVSSAARYQIITGTGTLTGSVTIETTGTPADGYTFWVDYRATFDVDVYGVSILGVSLGAVRALSGGVLVVGVYDATAGAYRVNVLANTDKANVITSDNINSLDGAKLIISSVPETALVPSARTTLYRENAVANSPNVVTGINAFAIGESNNATGNESIALGQSNTASGLNSVAIGESSQATTSDSIAIGDTCISSGQSAIAMGRNNTASVLDAVAIGNQNTANQVGAFAIGTNNTASGLSSMSIGENVDTIGDYSVGLGYNITASGSNSIASGVNAISSRYGQVSSSSGKHAAGATEYAQKTELQAFRVTTDATPALLFLDGAAENITVANNSVVNFKGILTAVQDAGSAGTAGDVSTWQFDGAIKNIGGVTALVGGGVYFETALKRVIKHTDTATAGGASTITLGAGASTVDDIYNLAYIYIISGTGAGQLAQIQSYVGSTKVATVTAAWGVAPDNTSVYRIVTQRNYDTATLAQDVELTANNTTDSLDVTVTGETNKTIYWHLTLICDEIKFA